MPRQPTRAAFTLVEMMVAMALTMFVLLILTQAFVTSLEAFSQLKSIGGMQANLRTVASILQADLQRDHFEGIRRLSDPTMLTNPPRQGFFTIYQLAPPKVDPTISDYVVEGWDNSAGVPNALPPPGISPDLFSYRANHVLGMTVKLRGNRPEDVFSALVPTGSLLAQSSSNFFNQSTAGLFQNPSTQTIQGQSYSYFNSQWADVYYFLVRTGTTDDPSDLTPNPISGATRLYALYRAQYLLVPNPITVNKLAIPATTSPPPPFAGISCNVKAGALVFNAPEDVANPSNRVLQMPKTGGTVPHPVRTGETPLTPTSPPSGATLLQSNVVSFQVQAFTQQSGAPAGLEFQDVNGFPLVAPVAGVYGVYDTANGSTNNSSITAVKITIRIFDAATKQSRQLTVIQDM